MSCPKLSKPFISYSMKKLLSIADKCGIPSIGLSRRELYTAINNQSSEQTEPQESFPIRQNKPFSIDEFIKEKVVTRKLTGKEEDDILRLKYLMSRHPSDCFVFSEERDTDGEYKGKLNRQNYSIIWLCMSPSPNEKKYILLVPKILTTNISSYCKGKRFIVIFLSIIDSCTETYHANIVICDKLLRTAERFEPISCIDVWYNPDSLDDHLNKLFLSMKFKYIKPLQYCPVMCMQTAQLMETGFEKPVERLGRETDSKTYNQPDKSRIEYCTGWTLFYADLRLTYPDIDRNRLIQDSLTAIKTKTSLTDFIDGYVEYALRSGSNDV